MDVSTNSTVQFDISSSNDFSTLTLQVALALLVKILMNSWTLELFESPGKLVEPPRKGDWYLELSSDHC